MSGINAKREINNIQNGYSYRNVLIEDKSLSMDNLIKRCRRYFDAYMKRVHGCDNVHSDFGKDIPKIFWKYYDLYRRNKITLYDYARKTSISVAAIKKYLLMVN